MGSFAFTKADSLTKTANIAKYDGFKFLIPQEFGGGFIKDYYRDFGRMGSTSMSDTCYDMYELLAQWNEDPDFMASPETDLTKLKKKDEHTDENRSLGIDIFFSDELPKYPLKLVSPSCSLTYEEVPGISLSDPSQGWCRLTRTSTDFKQEIESAIRKYPEIEDALRALLAT